MRTTNKSQKDDIMKELEDYVKEKNHKYLDDLSDIDGDNTPGLQQKDLNKSAANVPGKQDVYEYCDQMMKDLSHLDK